MRRLLDAILCVLRVATPATGLPTVHRWLLRLSQAGVFERLAHALTMADRERVGREAGPTGCLLDAQTAP